MRILIAAPHDHYNPYCRELGGGYVRAGAEVVYGLDTFWASNLPVDLVHVHWPEYLLDHWMTAEADGRTVCDCLQRWRRSAKVIATIHNALPHTPGSAWRSYYESVYALCDGFVHHGERSREWLSRAFPALAGRPSLIARFAAYTSFPCDMTRDAARAALRIAADECVILVFGHWRTRAELRYVARGVRRAHVPRKRLLLHGLLPARRFGRVLNRLERWRTLALVRNTRYPALLPPEKVQIPFRAADLLVIQRLRGLNSANVPLALAFGLPIVSPDVGVFGEEVRRLGNFVFDPADPDSLARALETAFDADLPAIGLRNLEAARSELTWEASARAILAFARGLGGVRPLFAPAGQPNP